MTPTHQNFVKLKGQKCIRYESVAVNEQVLKLQRSIKTAYVSGFEWFVDGRGD